MDIKVNEHTVVVFDLDDTLYNELDFLKSAYTEIAQSLEPKNWIYLYIQMFSMYRSNSNVFKFLSNTYAKDIQSLIEIYRNHSPDITPFEGVLDVFKAIKDNNGIIGIITDGRSITQRAKLKNLGLLSYIDKIVISEEQGSEKPSLDNFKAIENAFPASEYFYIADNLKKDFIAPNVLNWRSVGVIDNGKNIHHSAFKFLNPANMPLDFIFNFKELSII
ncbi:putative hydrolase of the HAD superfamily [Winogradskyella epiphytica]|uniref:Putative hydrolase of the HAD superfamily n=1 Tax=Winogradskyella epiphytica TaxID=262005 RepID=A0A2V4XJ82_9FLAO|nr:HAD family hydrolase [Winogradskyella epiphytica]PYE81713.1 putative hydrolase of the HAD superfamily [Winogradskyella epiphytica]GGW63203.1 hypothetical protein GCM10008085_13820 [Winogradskyella epiphytica]